MKTINIKDTDLMSKTPLIFGWVMIFLVLALGVSVRYQTTSPVEAIDDTEVVKVYVEPIAYAEPPQIALEPVEYIPDNRVEKIENYLTAYGSPYPELAGVIVEISDKYEVDPYVITAINCQESSCFKNCHNSNCSGYGITDSGIVLETELGGLENGLEDMISRYAVDWNGYYKNCGNDIGCIGKKYNPRESWRSNVVWFYNNISR